MRNTNEDIRPFVSVVVPVYNDPDGIETTVRSLLAQSYPQDRYEILIVDNGSKDNTRTVIERFEQSNEALSMLVEDEIQSSYAARNRGIRNASGSILAFIDADMKAAIDWLEEGVAELTTRACEYLVGTVTLHTDGPDTMAAIYDQNMSFPNERFVTQHGWGQTCNLFVSRNVFDDVGLFDARLESGGDREFGDRVANSGRQPCFSSNVCAEHPTRSSLGELVKKFTRLGRGHQQLRRYHSTRYGHPFTWVVSPIHWLPPCYPWTIPEFCREWNQLERTHKVALIFVFYLLHNVVLPIGELSEMCSDVSELFRRTLKGSFEARRQSN